MKGWTKLYKKRNVDGKYSDAIDKCNTIYKNLMDEVLGRNEETEKVLAA